MVADFDIIARATANLEKVEFFTRVLNAHEEDRAEMLRARFRYDLEGFAKYFWPGSRFDMPFNRCHTSLFAFADRGRYDNRETVKSAIAAPRGIGKSTVASFVIPVHGIVYDLEAFIVVLSAGPDLATDLTDDMRQSFKENELLQKVFGKITVAGGKSDFKVKVNGRPSVRVLGRSARMPIRGPKHQGERPTLVLIDDGERSDDVMSRKMRVKQWNWLTKDVLKIGRRQGGTHVHVRGTVLHQDSMLATCLRHIGWDSERWQSIVKWPDRQDLWEQCGRLYKDLSLGARRVEIVKAFYESNREEMDAGVEVLDDTAEPIFALYRLIWDEGLAAFLQEKQNEPRDTSASFFNSEEFARFRLVGNTIHTADGRTVDLRECEIAAFLDPIPGKELGVLSDDIGSGAGDYAAIAVVARDKFNYQYVLEVWMRRCKDTDQLNALMDICERYNCRQVTIESNGFQRLFGRDFERMLDERREAGKFWQIEVNAHNSHLNKNDRIAKLCGAIENSWLQFNASIRQEVFAQFDDFPNASHDDGPDSIAGARDSFTDAPEMGTWG